MCGHWSLGINRLPPIAAAAKAVAATVEKLLELSLQAGGSVVDNHAETTIFFVIVTSVLLFRCSYYIYLVPPIAKHKTVLQHQTTNIVIIYPYAWY